MITLTAKIDLISGNNGTLSSVENTLPSNNISSEIEAIKGVKKQPANPFILGASKIGDGSTFNDKVDYYIGRGFDEPELLTIKGSSINMINIAFDTINNIYPKSIYLMSPKQVDESATIVATVNSPTSGVTSTYRIEKSQVPSFVESTKNISVKVLQSSVRVIAIPKGDLRGYYIDLTWLGREATATIQIEFSYRDIIEEYTDDDAIFNIDNLGGVSEVNLQINKRAGTRDVLVISGIYADISIDINSRNLISLERTIQDRSDFKLPSYGIISNTGSLEFNDIDGEIRDYAELLLLNSGAKCTIYLNNTLVNKYQVVGTFETNDWDYDNNNRSVSVSLKDDLEEWQDIQVEGFDYDIRNPFSVIDEGKMSNLYIWLHTRTPNKYKMLPLGELDEKTQNILKRTTISYPLLNGANLWEQWNKICQVCGLYIYKNGKGEIVCSYTYGG